jgi:hypothetical protein
MLLHITRNRFAVVAAVFCLAIAAPALAGPPLLCHPYDIGGARSLPWSDARTWLGVQPDYSVAHLDTDTLALLSPSTPVIVRMETLRRAAIYAGHDAQAAARLLTALTRRAGDAERARTPDALAYMDAAYFTEALHEASMLTKVPEFADRAPALRALVEGTDGYALAAKALALKAGDPSMEFAAALIAIDGHREAYQRHADKARAGVAADTLLARNIEHVQ